jgi:hypothetical protein
MTASEFLTPGDLGAVGYFSLALQTRDSEVVPHDFY